MRATFPLGLSIRLERKRGERKRRRGRERENKGEERKRGGTKGRR